MHLGLHVITCYNSCQFLMKPEFSQQVFEEYSNIKFHENLSSGSRVVLCRWTDRHVEANSLLSQFCEGNKIPTRHQDAFSFHCLNFYLTHTEKVAEVNVDRMGM
jgi:hypothetical protein